MAVEQSKVHFRLLIAGYWAHSMKAARHPSSNQHGTAASLHLRRRDDTPPHPPQTAAKHRTDPDQIRKATPNPVHVTSERHRSFQLA